MESLPCIILLRVRSSKSYAVFYVMLVLDSRSDLSRRCGGRRGHPRADSASIRQSCLGQSQKRCVSSRGLRAHCGVTVPHILLCTISFAGDILAVYQQYCNLFLGGTLPIFSKLRTRTNISDTFSRR